MRRRSGALWVLVVLGALGAGALAWTAIGDARRPETPDVGGRADASGRLALLGALADRVVPSDGGGWAIAALDAEPAPDRWLLAAAAGGGADEHAVADAGGALRAWLEDPALARRAAGAIALASRDPLVVRALPPEVWAPVWQQGRAALAAGDPGGLPVALGVAGGHGPDAAAARELLDRRAGHPSCAVLPTSAGPLPGPGAELTVALRILAGREQPCPGAGAVLERVLVDPRWGAATAAGELADLVTLARPIDGGQQRRLVRQVDDWLDPENDATVDLATLVLVGRLRRGIGDDRPLPLRLALRLDAQVASEGRLPDRWSGPPSFADVAILRHLAAADLVPVEVADAAVGAAAAPPGTGREVEAVALDLLAGGPRPRCSVGPPPAAARRSLPAIVATEVADVVAAACDGGVDAAEVIGRMQEAPAAEQPIVAWAAIVATCRIQSDLVTDAWAMDLDPTGPFADDPMWVFGASVAADPVAACRAELAR